MLCITYDRVQHMHTCMCVGALLPAALGMQVLQQRTLLGTIEGAEESVDLGALLTRLSTVASGELKTRLNATLEAYKAAVVAFERDGILPDVGDVQYTSSTRVILCRSI